MTDKFILPNGGTVKNAGPGEGCCETVADGSAYSDLLAADNWRLKISNIGTCTFTLDDLAWNSVEQYLLCKKFKNFPLVVAMLRSASDGLECKTIAWKHRCVKGADLADYVANAATYEQNALQAKFDQNANLKALLLCTGNAKLVTFERGVGFAEATLLMNLRASYSE